MIHGYRIECSKVPRCYEQDGRTPKSSPFFSPLLFDYARSAGWFKRAKGQCYIKRTRLNARLIDRRPGLGATGKFKASLIWRSMRVDFTAHIPERVFSPKVFTKGRLCFLLLGGDAPHSTKIYFDKDLLCIPSFVVPIRTRTRTNTNPNGTEAHASSRGLRACVCASQNVTRAEELVGARCA
jgi:hypothetical protein